MLQQVTKQVLVNSARTACYGGRHTITLIPGEGIGPEMMGHLKQVYKEAAVPVDFEMIELDPSTDNYDDLYNVSSQEC